MNHENGQLNADLNIHLGELVSLNALFVYFVILFQSSNYGIYLQNRLARIKIPLMISLLAIGTELTTGQILNKNAQWLSIELMKLGIGVSYQLAVPDHTQLIQDALHFLEKHSKVIIITGGLGPTADDFTRIVLAKTYGLQLQWNEENWQKVQAKLNSKGVQIRSIHRQQCEYPEGAEILDNSAGVADGFTFSNAKVQIYALPGPPKEIAAIWDSHLQHHLKDFTPLSLRWTQSIWTVTGLPESEVAEKVNNALGDAGAQVLYRVHSPHVDVKLLYQEKDSAENKILGQKIHSALAPWLIAKSEDHT